MERRLKIVWIEDRYTDAELIKCLLNNDNKLFDFHIAIDKESFLQSLVTFLPDVVLCDKPSHNAMLMLLGETIYWIDSIIVSFLNEKGKPLQGGFLCNVYSFISQQPPKTHCGDKTYASCSPP
ncbi:MAG TPA: hypothetical protein VNV85_00830 [Puia sp.]|jgi:hypothetical protein|nr:hypothetical protein [Puia sp.]